MPSYESSQTLISFIRRLPSEFAGFTAGGAGTIQGQFSFQNQKIDIRVYTRPADKVDFFHVSLALFALPKTGIDPLFRQLLAWNNGPADTLRFGIDDRTDRIYLMCMRPVAGFAYEEFQYSVRRMTEIAADARARLTQNFGLTP